MDCVLKTKLHVVFVLLMLSGIPSTSPARTTVRDRLYFDILDNYNRKTLPVKNVTQPVYVGMTTFIINVNRFDEISGELSVTMAFLLVWHEERISWNNSEYSGMTLITVSPEDLWRPQLYLLQSSDQVTEICNTSIQPLVNHDGMVYLVASSVLKVSCEVDVTHFPFDVQTCELTIFSWFLTLSSMVLYAENSTIQENYYKPNSQWELRPSFIENCTIISGTPCLNLKIVLARRSDFFLYYIVIPLLFLGLINNLVFIMPPSSGERTSVAVTVFLSFIVYMGIVNDVVPQSSKPMALVYYFITFLLIYSCTILFLCVISLRIYDRKTDVPRHIQNLVWVLGLYCLRYPKQTVNREIVHSVGEEIEDLYDRSRRESKHEIKIKDCKDNRPFNDRHGVQDWQCTWGSIGKIFDFYSFLMLYLVLLIATAVISNYWGLA